MNEIRIDRERLKECMEIMCADYCIFPDICETQERLDRHCNDECPLNNLTCDDYWEKGDDDG